MNVLSLFDGMSCGQVALHRAGIHVDNYYASEIDKYAIDVAKNNWPNTIHMGDVSKIKGTDFNHPIDLLIGGSPCQGFSMAGKGLNFEDSRSVLFFEFVRLLNELKPKHFMLENVKMNPESIKVINWYLGVEPIAIDSSLVSAQSRKRLYWTNIPSVEQPRDKGINLIEILEKLPDCPIGVGVRKKSCCIRVGGRNSPYGAKQIWDSPFQKISRKGKVKLSNLKSSCLLSSSGGNHSDMDLIHTEFITRRYSITECERLQTLPDGYTEGVSNTQRYKMLGNGWTVDVIAHILKNISQTGR